MLVILRYLVSYCSSRQVALLFGSHFLFDPLSLDSLVSCILFPKLCVQFLFNISITTHHSPWLMHAKQIEYFWETCSWWLLFVLSMLTHRQAFTWRLYKLHQCACCRLCIDIPLTSSVNLIVAGAQDSRPLHAAEPWSDVVYGSSRGVWILPRECWLPVMSTCSVVAPDASFQYIICIVNPVTLLHCFRARVKLVGARLCSSLLLTSSCMLVYSLLLDIEYHGYFNSSPPNP